MGEPIPGAKGEPLPAPALTENTWQSIRSGHQLIYVGGDWVLDWVVATGNYKVWRVERNPAAGADPLPKPAIFQGNWAEIRTGHQLVYLGGDRLLDWSPRQGDSACG